MNRLKELRESQNLSQTELATKLGLVINSYSNYERNERTPNYKVLWKIADFYGTSIDYIVGRTDEKYVNKKAHSAGTENA